jgi:ATP-dependent helicase HrpB
VCVEDILKQEGLTFLNWNARCESWLVRATWLATVIDDFPNISKKSLMKYLDQWLLPYISHIESIKQLKQFNIFDLLTANLTWEDNQFLERHAPVLYYTEW